MKVRALALAGLLLVLAGALGVAVWQQTTIPEQVQDVVEDQLAPLQRLEAPEIETPGPLRRLVQQQGQALTRDGIVRETNGQRQANGQPALSANTKLNQAAEKKMADMFAAQYFDHVSPSGVGPADVVESTGYTFIATGENLALGNFEGDSGVVQAWMDSPGHRENILSEKYTEIGVAAAEGTYEGRRVWIAVQEFGRPLSDCPTPDPQLQAQFDDLKKEIETAQDALQEEQAALEAEATALEQLRTEAETSQDQEVIDEYNRRVDAFNARRERFNDKIAAIQEQQEAAQTMVAQINKQISTFNTCLQK